MIELSGLSPHHDVRIEITGLKSGEKLSEVLIDDASELRSTPLDKVRAISTRAFDMPAFVRRLRALERSAWENDPERVCHYLADLNIGYIA